MPAFPPSLLPLPCKQFHSLKSLPSTQYCNTKLGRHTHEPNSRGRARAYLLGSRPGLPARPHTRTCSVLVTLHTILYYKTRTAYSRTEQQGSRACLPPGQSTWSSRPTAHANVLCPGHVIMAMLINKRTTQKVKT